MVLDFSGGLGIGFVFEEALVGGFGPPLSSGAYRPFSPGEKEAFS